jgi:hypothetical protein
MKKLWTYFRRLFQTQACAYEQITSDHSCVCSCFNTSSSLDDLMAGRLQREMNSENYSKECDYEKY